MKKTFITLLILIWIFQIIPVSFASEAQVVILKLDDLRGNQTSCERFQKVVDYAKEENLKISFGVITNSIESSSTVYNDIIRGWSENAGVEIWYHGYTHSRGNEAVNETFEFYGLDYDKQYESFRNGIDLMKEKCGITMHSFGAPYNRTDAVTGRVMDAFPEIRVNMLSSGASANPSRTTLSIRADLETSTAGVVNELNAFKANLAAKASSPYVVLQGHPGMWGDTDFNNFKAIIKYLKTQNVEFLTPYEYHKRLTGETGIEPTYSPEETLRAEMDFPQDVSASTAQTFEYIISKFEGPLSLNAYYLYQNIITSEAKAAVNNDMAGKTGSLTELTDMFNKSVILNGIKYATAYSMTRVIMEGMQSVINHDLSDFNKLLDFRPVYKGITGREFSSCEELNTGFYEQVIFQYAFESGSLRNDFIGSLIFKDDFDSGYTDGYLITTAKWDKVTPRNTNSNGKPSTGNTNNYASILTKKLDDNFLMKYEADITGTASTSNAEPVVSKKLEIANNKFIVRFRIKTDLPAGYFRLAATTWGGGTETSKNHILKIQNTGAELPSDTTMKYSYDATVWSDYMLIIDLEQWKVYCYINDEYINDEFRFSGNISSTKPSQTGGYVTLYFSTLINDNYTGNVYVDDVYVNEYRELTGLHFSDTRLYNSNYELVEKINNGFISVEKEVKNYDAEDKELSFILASYDSDEKLTGIFYSSETISGKSGSFNYTGDIQIKSTDSMVKVFLWDTKSRMLPYYTHIYKRN